MRVIDPIASAPAPSPAPVFVEGEPDLQPPEELAVEVLDEDALLRDDADCELVDEDDLDGDAADQVFDALVHPSVDPGDDPDAWLGEFRCRGCGQVRPRHALADTDALICHRCQD
jgi:hypothetical protein